ncbi:hypothetical protein K7432_011541 [Basidiobolus ranarum]|uniref:Uncharacterized protein n=1 Tax=Basidiobolus ranarum TaxID=34480 RepID=A0ABR2VUN5_9FUNG
MKFILVSILFGVVVVQAAPLPQTRSNPNDFNFGAQQEQASPNQGTFVRPSNTRNGIERLN